jgi:hypothetical protein
LIQKQQEQQNALFQQQQQRQLGNIQLRNALRAEEEALAESEAAKGSSSLEDLAKRQRQAGLGKQALATEAALGKQRADKLNAAKTQIELMKASAGQIMANHEQCTSKGNDKLLGFLLRRFVHISSRPYDSATSKIHVAV